MPRQFIPLPEPRWYAVHTAARQESVAADHLERAGYWTFYPFDRVRVVRKRPGRANLVAWEPRPHFPRYIFVAIRFVDEDIRKIDAETIEGVSTVVRSRLSGRELRIPGAIIDRLMESGVVRFGEEDGFWRAALMRHEYEERELRVLLDKMGVRRFKLHDRAA